MPASPSDERSLVLDMHDLARHIRARMHDEGLTQAALAERVGKSAGTVSLALSGEARYASTLATLAEAVGLDVEGPFPAYRLDVPEGEGA
jgi:transcriptional regulator with XRE-family HTH domain